jgi:ComF family protein
LTQAADGLVAVLIAPRCAACDLPLDSPLCGAVCEPCWQSIAFITPPVCDGCGDPLPSWRPISQQRALCPRCRRTPRAVDRGGAVGPYDGALRQIVHALKYDRRRTLARRLAALMRARGEELLDGADCVVPVPLHRRRLRQRGFNQSADLAAHLGLPVLSGLTRTRNTPSQISLPAARRHRNVRDAFKIKSPPRWRPRRATQMGVAGQCVVLIDDVSTTGATLEACARALKAQGAREVRALTAARVVARRP